MASLIFQQRQYGGFTEKPICDACDTRSAYRRYARAWALEKARRVTCVTNRRNRHFGNWRERPRPAASRASTWSGSKREKDKDMIDPGVSEIDLQAAMADLAEMKDAAIREAMLDLIKKGLIADSGKR